MSEQLFIVSRRGISAHLEIYGFGCWTSVMALNRNTFKGAFAYTEATGRETIQALRYSWPDREFGLVGRTQIINHQTGKPLWALPPVPAFAPAPPTRQGVPA